MNKYYTVLHENTYIWIRIESIMKSYKTWLTIYFCEDDAIIEATMNYETKQYYLSHGNNDRSVTFGNDKEDIKTSINRVKCAMSALKYIKQELGL